jgi:hypothetical protein
MNESIPLGPLNIALIEDAAKDLEDFSEQIMAPARKLAETDVQIQALRRYILAQCVAITSSIDTIPPEMILQEMREGWLRELRQAVGALVLVVERLTDRPTAGAQP